MQTQFANVGTAEISLRSGLSAYLICITIAFTEAIPKANASAKRKTRFPVEIVKIVFSPLVDYCTFGIFVLISLNTWIKLDL